MAAQSWARLNIVLRAGLALTRFPTHFAAWPLSRGRVRMTAQLHVSKLTQFARMLTLPARKKEHLGSLNAPINLLFFLIMNKSNLF